MLSIFVCMQTVCTAAINQMAVRSQDPGLAVGRGLGA